MKHDGYLIVAEPGDPEIYYDPVYGAKVDADAYLQLQARLRALVEAARPIQQEWTAQLATGIEWEPKGVKILIKASDVAALAKAVEEAQV